MQLHRNPQFATARVTRCNPANPANAQSLRNAAGRGCNNRLGASEQLRKLIARAEGDSGKGPQEFGLAPAKPKTPYGEMLEYYLKMEPELFKGAVESQLQRMREEKEAKEAAAKEQEEKAKQGDAKELTLYKRMEEVRASEVRATLEDLMYVSILEKFITVGVEMLPRMDGFVDAGPTNLKALTEGIHSKEALELVREHLMSVMGPATLAQFSNVALKMSKFQMAQVYAASIMFGYFLRRVDQRFQLEKSIGTLSFNKEDAVARLERLFSAADAQDAPWDATPSSPPPSDTESESSTSSSSSRVSRGSEASTSGAADLGSAGRDLPAKKSKSALRKYVEGFDQATMVETARIVSIEGAALVERQTSALLGDIKQLTAEIQAAVGTDASSMEDVMQRMAKAVESDKVQTLTMTVGTQRRAVLEAVAFGTFLRDVETWVDGEYALLTPLPRPRLPPGRRGGRGSDDDNDE